MDSVGALDLRQRRVIWVVDEAKPVMKMDAPDHQAAISFLFELSNGLYDKSTIPRFDTTRLQRAPKMIDESPAYAGNDVVERRRMRLVAEWLAGVFRVGVGDLAMDAEANSAVYR